MALVCQHGCGRSWPHHPARAVACPQCGAAAGHPCKRPSGHPVPGKNCHRARYRAAYAAGIDFGPCPWDMCRPPDGGRRAERAAAPPPQRQGDLFA